LFASNMALRGEEDVHPTGRLRSAWYVAQSIAL
jgi:hypothetical protein